MRHAYGPTGGPCPALRGQHLATASCTTGWRPHSRTPGLTGQRGDAARRRPIRRRKGANIALTHVSRPFGRLAGFFEDGTKSRRHTPTTSRDEDWSRRSRLYRVNPPLRPDGDRGGVERALREGVLDFVATDHAPHASEVKELPIEQAAPGFLGHETAFAALHTDLVLDDRLPLARLVETMSCAPGRWVGTGGSLAVGAPADLTLADLSEEWTVGRGTLVSRSCNSPYLGRTLKGRVVGTIVGGEPVHDRTGARFGAHA